MWPQKTLLSAQREEIMATNVFLGTTDSVHGLTTEERIVQVLSVNISLLCEFFSSAW